MLFGVLRFAGLWAINMAAGWGGSGWMASGLLGSFEGLGWVLGAL